MRFDLIPPGLAFVVPDTEIICDFFDYVIMHYLFWLAFGLEFGLTPNPNRTPSNLWFRVRKIPEPN